MQNTNRDNSVDMKPFLFEHDYCRHVCMPDVEDNKENVFDKKLPRRFGAVDKWTNRLLVRVTTEDDWNKIIDRETAILKVQYPFLPGQQLRGKAYKKFGIPSVMGGVLSRASTIFGGVIPRKLLKSRKKNGHGMSHAQKEAKLEDISELGGDRRLQVLLKRPTEHKISIENEDPPGIETTYPMEASVDSNKSESLTPEFQFPGTNEQLSKFSEPIQSFERNSRDKIEIHSARTQIVAPSFKLFGERAVINDDVHEIQNDAEVAQPFVPYIVLPASSQIVSPAAMPTQLSIVQDSLYGDVNGNFVLKEATSSPKREERQSSSTTSDFSGNSAKKQQITPAFYIDDIDEISQLPTPLTSDFEISIGTNLPEVLLFLTLQTPDAASLDYSRTGYRKMPEFLTQEDLQENLASKDVDNDLEISFIKNDPKRKRRTNRRATGRSEDKENRRENETGKFREEKPRSKNFTFNVCLKNVLKPSCFDDNLNLVSQTRRLNLNDSCYESESTLSPESAPPEKKKRRLGSRDRVSSTFVTEDYGLTPYYPRGKKKKVQINDLTEEHDAMSDEEVLIVDEIEKNATAESSAAFVDNQEEKSTIEAITSHSADERHSVIEIGDVCDSQVVVESSMDILVDGRKKKSFLKSATDEKRSAIVENKFCDSNATAESPVNVFTDSHEQNSSPTSSATRLPATTSSVSELLSDRCCEYDLRFPNENSQYFELDTDLICESSLKDSFRVGMDVIHEQIDEILLFLETDIKDV